MGGGAVGFVVRLRSVGGDDLGDFCGLLFGPDSMVDLDPASDVFKLAHSPPGDLRVVGLPGLLCRELEGRDATFGLGSRPKSTFVLLIASPCKSPSELFGVVGATLETSCRF